MSSGKILLISYTFPPLPYGGTYRALRLCRGFVEQDLECHVVTINEYPDIPNDYELLATVPASVRVHRTPIIDPWRHYQPLKNRYAGRFWFRVVNKLISLLLRPVTFPDHMLLWIPFAFLRARLIIKQEGIDTLIVSSPPDSSQMVGWLLKKTCKVHWIADFRDPIFGNVAQVNMIDPSGLLGKFEKMMLARYDHFIARNADALIANTETHARALQQNYGCKNVHVVRNSFDPVDFTSVDQSKYSEFTISHIGSIYGNRNPDLLFEAINHLEAEYAPCKLNLRVVFIGLGGRSLETSIKKYGVSRYVSVQGQVPHKEAIEYMCRSHMMLLIKATGKWSQGQIPGKFFEYVGSRNSILCIGPKDSEVADIIAANKLGYVVEESLEEMIGVLRKAYRQFHDDGALPVLSRAQTEPFTTMMMVQKVCSLIGNSK